VRRKVEISFFVRVVRSRHLSRSSSEHGSTSRNKAATNSNNNTTVVTLATTTEFASLRMNGFRNSGRHSSAVKSRERRENRKNENTYLIMYVGRRLSLLLSVDGDVVGQQLATLSNHVPRARFSTGKRYRPGVNTDPIVLRTAVRT